VPGTGMIAIDKAGREENRRHKWAVADARQYLASDERNVYFRTADHRIIGVDRLTGEQRMEARRREFIAFATNTNAKDPGTIYAATSGGTVYAIRPVLKPGTVGEWVLDVRPADSVAMN
jgi:glucose dehydrogenase